nr:zinc finger, CCHC-type [Tanacetum cinerariifolium]
PTCLLRLVVGGTVGRTIFGKNWVGPTCLLRLVVGGTVGRTIFGKNWVAFQWLLQEIRVTWAHLEKKRIRQRLYTNSLEEYANSGWRRCRDFQATMSRVICDGTKSYMRRCQELYAKVSGFCEGVRISRSVRILATPSGRTDLGYIDFQQCQDEYHYDALTRFKDILRKVPHHGLDLWLQVQIFYDHVDYTTQMAIEYEAGGRLRKLRLEEAWKTIKDFAKYEEEEWNKPIFFEKGSPDYIDANLE